MRTKSKLILAGVAAVLATTAVVAADQPKVHVLNVLLPDGRIEQVRYTGDVAPRIVVRPAAPVSLFDAAFGLDSPFAAFERVSAEMQRQQAAMMRQVAAMASAPAMAAGAAPQMVALANAPAGARYSYVSTVVTNGKACTTRVEATSQGAGKAPQLLRQVSGDCSTALQRPTGPTPAAMPATPATPATPKLVAAPAPARPAIAPDSI